MSNEVRAAVVVGLIELAGSPDYRDRADAGRCLAGFAEMPETRGPLLGLVLDSCDTFVTRATAEALLRRQDVAGFAAVGSGLAAADPDHADWIHTAVLDVFGVYSRDRDAAVRECEILTRDPDEQVRRGASQLIAMLTGINPVLLPARDDQTSTAEHARGSEHISRRCPSSSPRRTDHYARIHPASTSPTRRVRQNSPAKPDHVRCRACGTRDSSELLVVQ
jgi:hypothetical protein